MQYIIDTEKGTCRPYWDNAPKEPEKKIKIGERMVQAMAPFQGTKEYEGQVGEVQKWFYGRIVEAAWCATWVSYFLTKVTGIGFKQENVYAMMQKLPQTFGKLGHMLADPQNTELEYGDILFWNWDGKAMTAGSSKHVNLFTRYGQTKQEIFAIGGNQLDMVCEKAYPKNNLYAVWRWDA